MNEATVTMLFPKRVMLTLNDYSRMVFEPGVREVPVSLAHHGYLVSNGVTRYAPPKQAVVNLEEADPMFVGIAYELWQDGKLAAFLEFAKEPKAFDAMFEARRDEQQKRSLHGSESYHAMQERVERDQLVRPESHLQSQDDDPPPNPVSDPDPPTLDSHVQTPPVEQTKVKAKAR